MLDINKLIEFSELQKHTVRRIDKRRFLFERIASASGKHMVGLVGPRGVGKTILMKQLAAEMKDSVYFSVDTLPDLDLLETVESLVRVHGFTNIFIDEVHFAKNYSLALKAIYDLLSQVRVYFSSSVALLLNSLPADLSRRVVLYTVSPFSFREYLYFKMDKRLPTITWSALLNNQIPREIRQVAAFFKDYLSGGLMPYALDEPNSLVILKNILEAILVKDIARISQISASEIDLIGKMVRFISKSAGVDGISFSSLSKNIGITKYKAQQYVELLELAFVLIQIKPYGTSVTKESKILMMPPYRLLENSYSNALGGLREDYFAFTLTSLLGPVAKSLEYLKSMRGSKTPDFITTIGKERIIFEIGGRGKSLAQFKDFKSEGRKIILVQDEAERDHESKDCKVPLHALGFLSLD
jgi:uncharacterized protein